MVEVYLSLQPSPNSKLTLESQLTCVLILRTEVASVYVSKQQLVPGPLNQS